jgi:uncharacterized membrane protein
MNLRRHGRFYIALAAGAAAFLLPIGPGNLGVDWDVRFLFAGDVFFLLYLVLTGRFVLRATADHLREGAAAADEGLPLILGVTAAAVVVSLLAVYLAVAAPGALGLATGLIAAFAIPLGWMTLHTMASFHYASIFYAPRDGRDTGGLDFPGDAAPGPWDFLYFGFVIGMTAQVSDVEVTSTRMRRYVLAHGVASFFYNTVIVALAVNAAISLAGR